MKKFIEIDFATYSKQFFGRAGEHNHIVLRCLVPTEMLDCDYLHAEFVNAANEKIVIEDVTVENGKAEIPLHQQLTVAGELEFQLVGYVVGEDEVAQVIAKSPIVTGIISASVNGIAKVSESLASLADRFAAKIDEMWGKMHTHSNKNVIDKLTYNDFSKLNWAYSVAESLPNEYSNALKGKLSGDGLTNTARDVLLNEQYINVQLSKRNLYDMSVLTTPTDISNCSVLEATDDYIIAQGNKNDGSNTVANGWIRPGYYSYIYNPSRLPYLVDGYNVTISADITVLEFGFSDPAIQQNPFRLGLVSGVSMNPITTATISEVGKKVRISGTATCHYTGYYYPIISLNSNKIKIENVKVEYGNPITDYESLELNVYGKNLFSTDSLLTLKHTEESDAYVFSTDESLKKFNLTPEIDFKPNTQYTFSFIAKQSIPADATELGNPAFRFIYTDGNVTDSEFPTQVYQKYTIVSQANKTIKGVYIFYKNDYLFHIKKDSMQLEEGTQATEYEEMFCDAYIPDETGLVTDIYPYCPNLTLSTSEKGVTIEAEYSRNLNAAVAELERKIESLRAEV